MLGLRRVAADHDFPVAWRSHHVKMIPKKNRDAAIFSKNRDLWMSPHGWGILTGCFRFEYDEAQERQIVPTAYGFRARRGAPAVLLALQVVTEASVRGGRTVARCWLDLLGFFMGISRQYLYRLERVLGVQGGITEAMRALQSTVGGRIITAHGLSRPLLKYSPR